MKKKLILPGDLLNMVNTLNDRVDLLEKGVTVSKEDTYTVKEVLKVLDISRTTLYARINNNTIQHHKVGNRTLFSREYIDQQTWNNTN